MKNVGYTQTNIELPDNLQADFGVESVHAQVSRQIGDGWVLNEWANAPFSGSVVQLHGRNTDNGRRYYHDFPTIEGALLAVDQVYNSAMAEANRIISPTETPSTPDRGELPELRDRRIQLGHWLMLTQVEKDEIESFFGGIYSPRARAINPLNIAAAAKAARMQQLQQAKKPGATMAMSHPLERALEERYVEIVKDVIGVRDRRKQRLLLLSFEENRALSAANSALDDLIENQDEEDLYRLKLITPHLRFRHEPFNLLGYILKQHRGHIEDVGEIEIVQRGLRFERFRNYYLEPFRIITSKTTTEIIDTFDALMSHTLPAISTRIEGLESSEIGGHYAQHTQALSGLAGSVHAALLARNPSLAQRQAKAFKVQLERHGNPKDRPSLIPWFYYPLSTQSRH